MERLQKVIAQNSEYSRRKAEELIGAGNVEVNGQVVTELGTKVDGSDEITINGNTLVPAEKVYYLLNKPLRTISSRSDEKDRTTVVDLIGDKEKIYPVGRLDYNTTGVLLLTNDGELANGLMHPKREIPKTYIATISGKVRKGDIYKLADGIDIGDGIITAPAEIEIIKYNPRTETGIVKITIYEGRNHQVKKMFEAIGGKVIKLKRTDYAFLNVDELPLGAYRSLKPKEIKKLYGLIK